MSTDNDTRELQDALRALPSGEDSSIHRLVAGAVEEGRATRLRRRRVAGGGLVAAAVLVAGSAVAATTWPDRGTGDTAAAVDPSQTASTALPGSDAADADAAQCLESATRTQSGSPMLELVQTDPVARFPLTGPDGDYTVLVYTRGDELASCAVSGRGVPAGNGPALQYSPTTRTDSTDGTRYVASNGTYGSSSNGVGGPVAMQLALGRAATPVVADVVVDLDGATYDADVTNGFYAVLLPASAGRPALQSATVNAYDADGQLLQQGPLLPGKADR